MFWFFNKVYLKEFFSGIHRGWYSCFTRGKACGEYADQRLWKSNLQILWSINCVNNIKGNKIFRKYFHISNQRRTKTILHLQYKIFSIKKCKFMPTTRIRKEIEWPSNSTCPSNLGLSQNNDLKQVRTIKGGTEKILPLYAPFSFSHYSNYICQIVFCHSHQVKYYNILYMLIYNPGNIS